MYWRWGAGPVSPHEGGAVPDRPGRTNKRARSCFFCTVRLCTVGRKAWCGARRAVPFAGRGEGPRSGGPHSKSQVPSQGLAPGSVWTFWGLSPSNGDCRVRLAGHRLGGPLNGHPLPGSGRPRDRGLARVSGYRFCANGCEGVKPRAGRRLHSATGSPVWRAGPGEPHETGFWFEGGRWRKARGRERSNHLCRMGVPASGLVGASSAGAVVTKPRRGVCRRVFPSAEFDKSP